MLPIRDLLRSSPVYNAMLFGEDDKPVYARLPDGTLRQIDPVVTEVQISTMDGRAHDAIVLHIGEQEALEYVEGSNNMTGEAEK